MSRMSTRGLDERDYLKCAGSKALQKCLRNEQPIRGSASEILIFSDTISKENRRGSKQNRVLIITTAGIYNFKPGSYSSYQRRIGLEKIEQIYLNEVSNEFVIHALGEYDYLLESRRRDQIVFIIKNEVKNLTGKDVGVVTLARGHIQSLIRTKKDTALFHEPSTVRPFSGNVNHTELSEAHIIHEEETKRASAEMRRSVNGRNIVRVSTPLELNLAENAKAIATQELMEAVDALAESTTSSTVKRVVAETPHDTPYDVVRLVAEMFLNPKCAKEFNYLITSNRKWGKSLLKSTLVLINDESDKLRYWSFKVLWCLSTLFDSIPSLKTNVGAFGFNAYFMSFLTEGKYSPGAPEYTALVEILVDSLARPGAMTGCEIFGKKIINHVVLSCIYSMLPYIVDISVKRDILKDMNLLIVGFKLNIEAYSSNDANWQRYLFIAASNVPYKEEDFTEVTLEIWKYIQNIFSSVHAYIFEQNVTEFNSAIKTTLDRLIEYNGWAVDGVHFARNIFIQVVRKIMGGCNRWKYDFDQPVWAAFLEFAILIEDFMFFRPQNEDVSKTLPLLESERKMLSKKADNVNSRPLRQESVHLHHLSCICEDLHLAELMMSLFDKLDVGKNGSKNMLAHITNGNQIQKERFQQACDLREKYKEIVAFFQGASTGRSVENTLLKVAEFLSEYKKKSKAAFASTATSKHDIMKTLQTSMMRQQAQTIIFKATVETALTMKKFDSKPLTIIEKPLSPSNSTATTSSFSATTTSTANAPTTIQITTTSTPTNNMNPNASPLPSVNINSSRSPSTTTLNRSPSITMSTAEPLKLFQVVKGSTSSSSLKGRKISNSSNRRDTASEDIPTFEPIKRITNTQINLFEEKSTKRSSDPPPPPQIQKVNNNSASSLTPSSSLVELPPDVPSDTLVDSGVLSAIVEKEEEDYEDEEDGEYSEGETSDEEQKIIDLCYKCGTGVVEQDMLVAMDKVWHYDHFCCTHCNKNISDDFLVQDDLPYCKEDFVLLFTKNVCTGCLKPVGDYDKALEALGRSWHWTCFCCTGCKKQFGESDTFFNIDNVPYCDECHRNIFCKCPGCDNFIITDGSVETPVVSALNRRWHKEHFVCTVCHCEFPEGNFFSKNTGDGEKPYCEAHFLELFTGKCPMCKEPVTESGIWACNQTWHAEHFECKHCQKRIITGSYFDHNGHPYCEEDYFEHYAQRCPACNEPVVGEHIVALNSPWHPEHLCCSECNCNISSTSFFERDSKLYCEKDFNYLFNDLCARCNKRIVGEQLTAIGQIWHPGCLNCTTCSLLFNNKIYAGFDGKPYCLTHFDELFGVPLCAECHFPIGDDDYIKALGQNWHPLHFKCYVCGLLFGKGDQFFEYNGKPICKNDYNKLCGELCPTCSEVVIPGDHPVRTLNNKMYHFSCLVCLSCDKPFGEGESIILLEEMILCKKDSESLNSLHCALCDEIIASGSPHVKALEKVWHPEHVGCVICNVKFANGKFMNYQGWPVCFAHFTIRTVADNEKIEALQNKLRDRKDVLNKLKRKKKIMDDAYTQKMLERKK